MASKTYGYLFKKVINQTSLSNTYNDWTTTTELIKQTFSDVEINALSNAEWFDRETSFNFNTVAGQAVYPFPTGSDRVKRMFVLIGNRRYYLDADRLLGNIAFDRLMNFPTVASDIPQYWNIQNGQINIFPKPATGWYQATIYYTPIATGIVTDPTSSTDQNTSCSVKAGYEDMLFFKGVEMIFRQREQDSQANIWEKKYNDKYAEYWNKVSNPTPASIVKYGRWRFANPNLYPMNLTKV